MPLSDKIHAAFRKPFIPALFFFGGVTFDSLTLTRIDRLSDNLVLLTYLSLLGFLIVLLGRAERSLADKPLENSDGSLVARSRPYFPLAIQFLFGNLFSAYAIFYSRSASWTSTIVFFGLILALLIGNEFLHDRIKNLRLLASLYALVACSFLTFFLPVVTGVMTTSMFVLGALLSLMLTLGLIRLIYRKTPFRSLAEARRTALLPLLVVAVMIGFYFLNWIPPVPLSLAFGGVYHNVGRSAEAFELTYERGPWYRFWKRSDEPFRGGGPAYCFTAIFAPAELRAEVFHHWQYRPAGGGRFITTDRIRLPISGGREGGYRAYTVKQRVMPGDWRVDVVTMDGRIIGRVAFRVEEPAEIQEFEMITY